MQSQYHAKNEIGIKEINDRLIRSGYVEFAGSNLSDHFYHLSENGLDATLAIVNMDVPAAGITAPINVFTNSAKKAAAKKLLEGILETEIVEVVH